MEEQCKVTDLNLYNPFFLVVDEGGNYSSNTYQGLILIPRHLKDKFKYENIEAGLGEIEGKHSDVHCEMKFKEMTEEQVYNFILNKDYWCATEMLNSLKYALEDANLKEIHVEILELNKNFYSNINFSKGATLQITGTLYQNGKKVDLLDYEWLEDND